jgi:hypothetical protein
MKDRIYQGFDFFTPYGKLPETVVFVDITHLICDELESLARSLGLEKEYQEISKKGEMNMRIIRKWMPFLNGKSIDFVAQEINKTEPYLGIEESIIILNECGVDKIIGISDNPLLIIEENQGLLRSIGINEIHTTSSPVIRNRTYTGEVEEGKTKSRIMRELVTSNNYGVFLSILQGKNDEDSVPTASEYGRTLSVNSRGSGLKEMTDYHVDSTVELPEFLRQLVF